MADYGAQDTSTTSLGANQFPISEAWTPNAGFSAVEGGTQTTDAGGKKSAPVRIEVKDGSDLTQGAQADAAYTSGSGSIISLLKGIFGKVAGTLTISGAVTTSGTVTEANSAASKTDLDTIVTNTNKIPASPATEGGHLATIDSHIPALGQALAASSVPVVLTSAQQTALTPPSAITGFALEAGHIATIDTHTPALGQATKANSVPVALASDQSAIPINASKVSLFSTTQTAQGTGNSGDLDVSKSKIVVIDVNITANPAGSNPTFQLTWNRKGLDGIYYPVWLSDLINGLPANPTKISVSIGPGTNWPEALGATGQLAWTVGGTASPTYTFTPSIQGEN